MTIQEFNHSYEECPMCYVQGVVELDYVCPLCDNTGYIPIGENQQVKEVKGESYAV